MLTKEFIKISVKDVLLKFDPVEFGDDDSRERLEKITDLIADKLINDE